MLYAKTDSNGQPCCRLASHLRDVGYVAQRLLKSFPAKFLKDYVHGHEFFPFIAALHDIGKANNDFQRQLFKNGKGDPLHPHNWHSQHFLEFLLSTPGTTDGGDNFPWPRALGAHHGRWYCGKLYTNPTLEMTNELAADVVREIFPKFNLTPPDDGEDIGSYLRRLLPKIGRSRQEIVKFFAGLTVLADWLASNRRIFPYEDGKELTDEEAAVRADGLVVELPQLFRAQVDCEKDFSTLFGLDSPNALQLAMAQVAVEPGLFIVEASMGQGKTEAALLAVRNLLKMEHSGLYFALPTQLTSEKIHSRVCAFVQNLGADGWDDDSEKLVELIHGNLLQGQVEEGDDDWDWFSTNRRRMLCRYGVGTIDQALLQCINVKHAALRTFALANRVIILDEVHSYDTYTATIIQEFIKVMGNLGSTVIILSGTLTVEKKAELLGLSDPGELPSGGDHFPAITYRLHREGKVKLRAVDREQPRSYDISYDDGNRMSFYDDALGRLENGECVLWLRNTVVQAQEDYLYFRRALCEKCHDLRGEDILGLMHSRFTAEDRGRIEGHWTERLGNGNGMRKPCILVATQVAEQSLDIDCDTLFTEHCPTDMLLQRMGRCRRHGRSNRCAGCEPDGRVYVFRDNRMSDQTAKFLKNTAMDSGRRHKKKHSAVSFADAYGRSAKVYSPYILERSHRVLSQRTRLTFPDDIRGLLKDTYEDSNFLENADLREAREEFLNDVENLRMHAVNAMDLNNTILSRDDAECAKVRLIAVETVELILLPPGDREIFGKFLQTSFDGKFFFELRKKAIRVPKYFCDNAKKFRLDGTAYQHSHLCVVDAEETKTLCYDGDGIGLQRLEENGEVGEDGDGMF
jgi:CRISPR-associated endonuclease/helicase Cas3